jgi:hypothetical protein
LLHNKPLLKKIIAAVGGTIKVIGIKIATPLTEPRPGIAPTNNPMRHPNIKRAKFNNSKDVAIP